VYCDFRHGIFNSRTIPSLIDAIPKGCYRVADSQVASRWGNIIDFKGFDLITPNEREARFALGDQDSGIRPLASRIFDETDCGLLILKVGERGVLTCRSRDHEALDSFFVVDSFLSAFSHATARFVILFVFPNVLLHTSLNPARASIFAQLGSTISPLPFGAGIRCTITEPILAFTLNLIE